MFADVPDETWELVSYTMGCSSVLIWLCAQLPQIKKNWQRRSVEGLSPGFLAAWILGDASNLLGCFLTNQLGVQVLLASYYCLVDVVLGAQYWLYRPSVQYIEGVDTSMDVFGDISDNTNRGRQRSRSRLEQVRDKVAYLIGMSMIKPVSSLPLPEQQIAGNTKLSGHEAVAILGKVGMAAADGTFASDLGFFVAYFSTGMYLFSRVPQIYHNFQRKSTTGVSMLLFMSAFLGNLTYTLSILLAPQSMGQHAHRKEFLLRELSYILGAAGTMLFDCVILGQWLWYQRITARHRRRSTQPLDRIQRPYLGTRPSTPASYMSSRRPSTPALASPPANWDAFPVLQPASTKRGDTTPLLSSSNSPPRIHYASNNESPFHG